MDAFSFFNRLSALFLPESGVWKRTDWQVIFLDLMNHLMDLLLLLVSLCSLYSWTFSFLTVLCCVRHPWASTKTPMNKTNVDNHWKYWSHPQSSSGKCCTEPGFSLFLLFRTAGNTLLGLFFRCFNQIRERSGALMRVGPGCYVWRELNLSLWIQSSNFQWHGIRCDLYF